MPPDEAELEDEAGLLRELKAISNRHSAQRYALSSSSGHTKATSCSIRASASASSFSSTFLQDAPEDQQLNQYWYSQATIDTLREALLEGVASLDKDAPRVAFLSTPSLFFAFDEAERSHFFLFDYESKATWSKDANYVYYDYNDPLKFDETLRNSFDVVVIDPPFITREVWDKYAQTAKALAVSNQPLVIATTVIENAPLMKELFDATPTEFQPSIPNLVYQYACFTNFPCVCLSQPNEEIAL